MKCLSFIITIVLLISSCSKNKVNYPLSNTIDISKTLGGEYEKIALSKIASKIEYIALETDSTCLINHIRKINEQVKFTENQVFISDKSQLLSFDLNGDFLNKIGSFGRGPQEYSDIRGFTVLSSDNSIAVFSASIQKTLIYNFEGQFKKKLKIDFFPISLSTLNQNLVFANPKGRRDFSDYKAFSVISPSDGKLKRRILSRGFEEDQDIALSSNQMLYKLNDTLSFWEFSNDTIWRISNYDKIEPRYFIRYDNKMPEKYLLENNAAKQDEQQSYTRLWRYIETNKYFFFKFGNKNYLNHIFYNKLNGESYNLRYKKRFSKGFNFSFLNDIDGGMPFWPEGYVSGNKVFKLVYGYEIRDYMERQGDNFDAKDLDAREQLIKLAEKSKISDNPILMIVTLK